MKHLDFKDLLLFENDTYIVINKPPFISTLEDRQGEGKQNIIALAKGYHENAQVCHRLDKETSGALAIAKNTEAYRHLALQFQKRQVNKIYHAVADGIQDFDKTQVKLPILSLKTGTVKIDKVNGKDAETFFTTLQVFRKHTLIECQPLTGRMHQIRIHLAVLKAPISCDKLYGGKQLYLSDLKKKFKIKKDTEEQSLIQRLALHAFQLEFTDLNDEKISVQAPYPKDIKALLNQLRKTE